MSEDKVADLSGLFDSKAEVKKWVTEAVHTSTEPKIELPAGAVEFVGEPEEMPASKEPDNPELHRLGLELEEARAGRHVSDIGLKDPYWDAQNRLQAFYRQVVENK